MLSEKLFNGVPLEDVLLVLDYLLHHVLIVLVNLDTLLLHVVEVAVALEDHLVGLLDVLDIEDCEALLKLVRELFDVLFIAVGKNDS